MSTEQGQTTAQRGDSLVGTSALLAVIDDEIAYGRRDEAKSQAEGDEYQVRYARGWIDGLRRARFFITSSANT